MELEGKNVLITGAAVRIGACICEAFARNGANIVLHYHNSGREAEKLCARLVDEYAVKCRTVKLDLAETRKLDTLFTADQPIDVLVNNASLFDQQALSDETIDQVRKQFDINFFAPMELMRLFCRQELETGCVVNILDQRITKQSLRGGSYSLTKKALAELTEMAALQWAPKIRVNGIAPGPVLPPVHLHGKGMTVELNNVPLQRPVDMNDLAESCLFLVKNDSITGEILFVDCGQHLNPA